MTLIVDHLPDSLSQALEARARNEGKSVPQLAVEILTKVLRPDGRRAPPAPRDLSGIAGTMSVEDARAIEETVRRMDERFP
jgi:plasmid stability protein